MLFEGIYSLIMSGPIEADEHADMNLFVGDWYEIARISSGCTFTDMRYTFTANPSNRTFTIKNTYVYANRAYSITGSAREIAPGKLQVSFLPVVPYCLYHVQQWVLDTDNDKYAMIGSPSRKHLSILSRTSDMDQTTYDALVRTAQERGFDTARIRKTVHTPPYYALEEGRCA